ncbi:MAG: twin-arginine translocation signal domain-containing protein, partial [Blastocatellia bacterium]
MSKTSRRDFMKTTSVAAAGLAATSMPAYSYDRIVGSNGKVRTAIVGAGDRMMQSLVPAYFSQSEELNFELVAVCDIWKHHRETNTAKIQSSEKYKTKAAQIATARNTDELYAMKDIDAVMIATADFQHAYH